MEKLVRDQRPMEMLLAGKLPKIRVANDVEFGGLLWEKLDEEVQEAKEATGREELAAELADVAEVVIALAEYYEIDFNEAILDKRNQFGQYNNRFVWMGMYEDPLH